MESACIGQLARLKPDDFPDDDLRSRFQDVWARLTAKEQTHGEGRIAASIRAMSDEEAREVIQAIVNLYDAVARLYGQEVGI